MFCIRFLPLFLLLLVSVGHSQNPRGEFGKPTKEDFAYTGFEGEPSATGVILYESGNYYAATIVRRTAVRLVKEVYRKIKVLDAKNFDYSSVEIQYYDGNGFGEEIIDYKAVTHNGKKQDVVEKDAFYEIQISRAEKALAFTFPNIQDGSILEYKFTIVSPYFFSLDGWEFQHELPTVYSKFQTVLPINFRYNKIFYGDRPLSAQRSEIKLKDFVLPANNGTKDSEMNIYAMENIPSYYEERYMLSHKNYISRVAYEPLVFKAFYGHEYPFTKTWEDVDNSFKSRKDFGSQLSNKGYFRRKLPKEILKIDDDLERAKAVYSFIQKSYTWNNRYFHYGQDVRDAFSEKLGSVSSINLSLVNALEAAQLESKPVILSTRANGLPTEIYPVLSNFNYVVAMVRIGNEKILLDATNKQAPFGILPFRALNGKGRVMDFDKGSYWLPITPFSQNIDYVKSQINTTDDGKFIAKIEQSNYGYIALAKRERIEEYTFEKYLKEQEKAVEGIDIKNYKVEDLNLIDQPLTETFSVSITPESVGENVLLYPFAHDTYISENPFKRKSRSYPMDFGYPFTNTYLVSINLNDIYKIEQIPESRSIKLPNSDGECSITYLAEENTINIRFSLKLNTTHFPPDAYPALQKFFGTMVTMLKEESIILKRK